jgi:hypothetical protein
MAGKDFDGLAESGPNTARFGEESEPRWPLARPFDRETRPLVRLGFPVQPVVSDGR